MPHLTYIGPPEFLPRRLLVTMVAIVPATWTITRLKY